MGLAVAVVNRLIMLLYRKSAKQFEFDLNRVDEVQKEILLTIINENKNTDYGKKYGFEHLKSIEDYRENVPIANYTDFKPYIDKIADGKENVLTKEKVNMFEITGGSGGHVKLIPYTQGLKNEFLQGIKPWLYSLYKEHPRLKNGKSYWSITPPTFDKKYTAGGVSIGFEDDTAYFGKIEQFLTDIIFVRDKTLKTEKDMDKFYFKTCLCLLNEKNLSLISVWNPSYLLVLVKFIKDNEEELLASLPKKRRVEIEEHVKKCEYNKIWKKLSLISCWCDGLAESGSNEIKALFGDVYVQPKGILSTEAFMTLPYKGSNYSILSYKSHYFEFIDIDNGEIFNYTSLQKGRKYEIIFTTSGGFYRYRINDEVLVADYTQQGLPLLKFIGKTDKTSDYHGEKLNELFLKEITEQLYSKFDEKYRLKDRFKLFAYENSRYVLYLQSSEGDSVQFVSELKEFAEKLLCNSYHYKLCRDLKQLLPLHIKPVYGDAKQAYLNFYLNKGKKLGDIKPELLSLHIGWEDFFEM